MDRGVLVSVVVPCLNGDRYLEPCLNALFSQTLPKEFYEVIFVDNRSTDGSLDTARRFPTLVVLEEPVRCSYAARNRGVAAANSGLLAFIDCDCEAAQDWLERLVRAFDDPGVVLALGAVRYPAGSRCLEWVADYEAARTEYAWSQSAEPVHYAYGGNMAVRRGAFDRCGPFLHVSRGADSIFANEVRAVFGVQSVRCVPSACVRHLEVTRFRHWAEKMAVYSHSCETSHAVSGTRALRFRERVEVWRRTAAAGRYGRFRAACLAGLLVAGLIPFEAGRAIRRLRDRVFKRPGRVS